jgi:hypothetical protein
MSRGGLRPYWGVRISPSGPRLYEREPGVGAPERLISNAFLPLGEGLQMRNVEVTC